jgi:pimeloyl-ACP methyl ester carboxylesterase
MQKTFEYDMRFVLHPEDDASYVHFENAGAHAFQASPASVPRVNVWWLADAALLSYWKPPDATRIFGQAGLQAEYLEANGTDCYVTWNDSSVIVAFRGTQPDEWRDILSDIRTEQLRWDVGYVHAGFAAALDGIWAALSAKLAQLASTRSVWFCGHSLGAAIATLAAYRHPATSGLCTFGSPRVGDETFATAFNMRLKGKALRYVNDQDIVTHVPPPVLPPWTFRHVDQGRFIAPDGIVSDHEPTVAHFFADVFGRPTVLLETINGLLNRALTSGPVALLDHMPKAYAVRTWNDYDAYNC